MDMPIIELDGYMAKVVFDPASRAMVGTVINTALPILTFQADNASALEKEFAISLKVYREMCAEKGVEPARPAPGRFTLRPDVTLHARMQLAADAEGLTVSKWALDKLAEAIKVA